MDVKFTNNTFSLPKRLLSRRFTYQLENFINYLLYLNLKKKNLGIFLCGIKGKNFQGYLSKEGYRKEDEKK